MQRRDQAGRISFEYTDTATVLNQLGLTEGQHLINAGKVLFSDDILQDLQLAIFATNERHTFNDIQRFHGPVLKLVDIAETYIRNNIHWRVEFDGSIRRKEIPEIPMDAVREALLNSFCHKDHGSGQSNEVAIYKNRVEIFNPGVFPKGYEPKDFIENIERPIRRNPIIARMLYYSKEIESFGTGLKRIMEACRDAGVKYEFRQMKSGFMVVFYRDTESCTQDNTQVSLVNTQDNTRDDTQDVSGNIKEQSNYSTEDRILNYCKEPRSIMEMTKFLGYRERKSVRKHLMPLLAQNKIAMTIPEKPSSKNQKYVTVNQETDLQ